jgi:hypothetical protein
MKYTLFALALPLLLLAANFKLYLKDGTYHVVREYKLDGDRISYYSVERRDWEELPAELVDLTRTKKEVGDKAAADKESAKLIDEEEKAERALAKEVASVPQGFGVYYVNGNEVVPVKIAEAKVNNNKRRSVLAVMMPVPVITGKATLELDGEASAFVVKEDKPEFYFRLSQPERFGIVKLKPGKNKTRVVEDITIVPVSKETVEERVEIEVFRRQMGEELYKVWPMQSLEPGEYAAIQFTEGKINAQIWDFSYKK